MDEPRVEHYRRLYTAIGQMTIRWAALEMATDVLVATIFRTLPSDEIQFPEALNRKTKFIRRYFTSLEPLKRLSKEAVIVADRIDKAASDRKWIIHGVVGNLPEFEASGTLQMLRSSYQKSFVAMDTRTITVDDIDGYSVQFSILMNEANRLSSLAHDKLHDPNG